MTTPLPLFAALALSAAQAAPPVAVPAAPPAALSQRAAGDLRCAAVFAIIAAEQRRGAETALAFPPLAVRGREFFVRAGAAAMQESGLDREAVRVLFEAQVSRLQQQAQDGAGPDAVLAEAMPGCLARLDAVVAALDKPVLAQCMAIMQLAADEVHGAEGLTSRARDLRILAGVLEGREREALAAKGLSASEIDRAVIEQRERTRAEARADKGIERYDLSVCYDFAKPDEARHY